MENVILFACIEKNIGDDLFVNVLAKRYPDVHFLITSKAKYGSIALLENVEFSDALRKWLWASSTGRGGVLKNIVGTLLQSFYARKLGPINCGVCIVGNAFKMLDYRGKNSSRWMRNQIKLVKRYFLISTNFGPYTDERWKRDFDHIFPQMEDVCFRDQQSYQLFQSLPNVRYAPDAVLTLGRQPKNQHAGKRLLVSLIDCSMPIRGKAVNDFQGPYEDKLAQFINSFLEQGYDVTVLNSNTEQDLPACMRICEKCVGHVDILNYDGDLSQVFQIYSNSDVVISTRLHTTILAWLFDLPVLPISYDIKVQSILNSYAFTEKYLTLEDMETVPKEFAASYFGQYGFHLPERILQQAHSQFAAVDQYFESLGLRKKENG